VPSMAERLDPTDVALVDELCADGRATYQELGRRIGLSATATADRVRRLQSRGVITGYRAIVDPDRLGRTVEAAIDVRLANGADREVFAEVLRREPSVVEAIHVTGLYDYVVRVFCTGTAELDRLLATLKLEAEVVETQTRLLLHRIPDLDQLGPSLEPLPQPQPPPG
jgi:Lrp/AsnC family transcriptional regulator, leucine-responsive regulatory protein